MVVFKFDTMIISLKIYYFFIGFLTFFKLTDRGENVQKWTRVFSSRRWVILVDR